MTRLLKLLHAPDAAPIADAIRAAFHNEPGVATTDELDRFPPSHTVGAAVFILTDGAAESPALADTLHAWTEAGLPVLPVVPEIARYDFSALPEPLAPLRRLNAVGWDQGERPGDKVLTAIRQHLGLVPFKRHCKVFISYCRTDGRETALEVHNHLHSRGFRVFLDTEDIEPGDDVQGRIEDAINERDFLLLIDSPKAADSPWIMTEVAQALQRRVTVGSLKLPGDHLFPLMRGMPTIDWRANDPSRDRRLEDFISNMIASKETFDVRVDRAVRELANLLSASVSVDAKRQLRLSIGEDDDYRDFLIEYEDAPLSLDRFYRLHTSYESEPSPSAACFLHGGPPLSPLEREAAAWCRGSAPLWAAALTEIKQTAEQALEPKRRMP